MTMAVNRRPQRRRGFMNEAVHLGRRALGTADHFRRTYGPGMKQLAMGITPSLRALTLLWQRGSPQRAARLMATASCEHN